MGRGQGLNWQARWSVDTIFDKPGPVNLVLVLNPLSGDIINKKTCEVDFYLLGQSSPGVNHVACDLALMSAERSQRVFVITSTKEFTRQLDDLMWVYPEGRFLPHASAGDEDAHKAPVVIGGLSDLNTTDVVINLCPKAVPQPERFKRVLEIVPFADNEKKASREKFKSYRNLGLLPGTHEHFPAR